MHSLESTEFASFLASRNYSTKDLCSSLGISKSCHDSWCAGKNVPSVLNLDNLNKLAEFFDVPVEEILLTYPPLEALQAVWSRSQGVLLEEFMGAAGETSKTLAEKIEPNKSSIDRWIQGRTKPRPKQLGPMLDQLNIDPALLLDAPKQPEVSNEFADRLRAIWVESKLSQRQFADALGVQHSSLVAWIQGRAFPRGAVRTHLESTLRITVEETKTHRELSNVSLEGRPEFAKYLVSKRLELGLSLKRAAELIEVGYQRLAVWESEEVEFPMPSLRKISSGYGLTAGEVSVAKFGEVEGTSFGAKLRRLRLERLLSVEEVATAAGMKPLVYRRYEEHGHFPGRVEGRLEAIAAAFSISLAEFLGLEENKGRFAKWLGANMAAGNIMAEDLALVVGDSEEVVAGWLEGSTLPDLNLVSPLAGLFNVSFGTVRSYIIT